ncbi:MAG: hypothetical protein QOH92_1001 [Chloroflexota bacterium]|jgi:hypothetical protein|nr:hypothetical protein [Chloroflexota bacterium]
MLAWTLGIWGWDLEAAAQEAERAVAAAASAEEALPLVFALTARGTIDNQRGLPGALAHLERAGSSTLGASGRKHIRRSMTSR